MLRIMAAKLFTCKSSPQTESLCSPTGVRLKTLLVLKIFCHLSSHHTLYARSFAFVLPSHLRSYSASNNSRTHRYNRDAEPFLAVDLPGQPLRPCSPACQSRRTLYYRRQGNFIRVQSLRSTDIFPDAQHPSNRRGRSICQLLHQLRFEIWLQCLLAR